MRKLSTKVRRVLVLTAMFVVMASIPVMAAIEYHDYMDTELTVYRANGEKRCVAKTIANTNEFIYSHLHLIITYEMDIDCFDTEHWVQNSREQVGDYCRMSSN